MSSLFENQVEIAKDKVTLNPISNNQRPNLDDSETQALHDQPKINEEATFFEAEPQVDKEELARLFADELQALRDTAQKQGYAEGKTAGEREAQEQLATLESELKEQYENAIAQLTDLTANMKHAINQAIETNEADLIELTFAAVIKILGDKAVDKKLVKAVINNSIQACHDSNITKIKLNQQDYKLYIVAKEEFDLTLADDVAIEPDVNMLPGGCKIETDKGTLDARLDSQLERFKAYLLESYSGKFAE